VNRPPLRWAIVIVRLDPVEGHEQAGTRRVLVVSAEPFHRSGMMTVCPISARRSEPRYPGEVGIPRGHAGQTEDAVILCQQVRTISTDRITADGVGAGPGPRYVTDARIRAAVRDALTHHLGLDIPAIADGAA
jgi:mRNA interferase MazF